MKLIIEDDEGRKTVVPFVRDEISIGRKEGNTIRLTERNVSRRHARLVRGGSHVFIEDLGSYNGVKVNGGRVQGRSEIREGDLIEIGDYNLAVQAEAGELANPPTEPAADAAPARAETTQEHDVLPPPGQAAASPPPMPTHAPPAASPPNGAAAVPGGVAAAAARPSPAPAQPPPPAAPPPRREATAVIRVDLDALNREAPAQPVPPEAQPRLVVLSTEYAGQSFPLERTAVTLGRDGDNEVPIDHRSMSRTHCRIYREKTGAWKVADLGSANGVKVNGEPYGASDLRGGDVLQLGHVKLRFCDPGDPFELTDEMAAAYADVDDDLAAVKRSSAPLWIGVIVVLALVGTGGWWVFGRNTGKPAGADTTGPQPLAIAHPAHPAHAATGSTAGAAGTPAAGTPAKAAAAPPTRTAPAVNTRALLAEAKKAEHQRDWDGARRAYREVLAAHAGDAAALSGAQRAAAEARAKATLDDAVAAAGKENYDAALKDLAQIPDSSVYAHPAATERARIKARQEAARRKALADARTRRRAAARQARAHRGHTNHAAHAAKAKPTPGKKAEAQQDYKQGYALILKYKYRQAISYLKKALALDPVGMAPAHRLLGVAYASVGQMDQAAYHYREYIKKNPHAPDRAKVEQILQQYDQSTGK